MLRLGASIWRQGRMTKRGIPFRYTSPMTRGGLASWRSFSLTQRLGGRQGSSWRESYSDSMHRRISPPTPAS